MKLEFCPNCKSTDISVVNDSFARCEDCYMQGPKVGSIDRPWTNDYIDRENAIEKWNNLPREK